MQKCLNCGYERQPKDGGIIPYTGCPRCHIIYDEIKDESRTSERFSLEGGVINDSVLGLEWAPVNYERDMSHLKAEKYARNLSLAGGGWRLPTRDELKSLYDTSRLGHADPVFRINSDRVWTSELNLWGMYAWFFAFGDGTEDRFLRTLFFDGDLSSSTARILAVRSRQKEKQDIAMWSRRPSPGKSSSSRTSERFYLESGIINDSELGLQWAFCNGQSMNHLKAAKYARNLSLAGGGWRLPTREELMSLYDTGKPGRLAAPLFNNINECHGVWTSELNLWGMGAWFFDFRAGYAVEGLRFPPGAAIGGSGICVLAVRTRR